MTEEEPGTHCQKCTTWNHGWRETCRKCGTRLLIVTGDRIWEDELEEPGGVDGEEDLDEHLLERITILEESQKRIETYLETFSEQLGKLERSEVMLRNGLMSLVQEMEQKYRLDSQAFSQRWETAVEDNLQLLSARENFTKYRPRILAISDTGSMSQLKRSLFETTALLDSGRLTEAAARLEEALTIDPKNHELLFSVAALKDINGDTERACHLAQKVIQLNHRHYEAWMLVAKIAQLHPAQPAKAVEALRVAAGLRPEELGPRTALAELLLFEDDPQGALEASAAALELERNGNTLRIMGEILIELGEHTKAITLLKEAADSQPGEIGIMALLAEGYLCASKSQKAFAILKDLMKQYPGDTDLYIMVDSLTPALLKSARGGNRHAQSWLDEAEDWLQEGNLESAGECLREAAKICTSDRSEWVELQILAAKDTPKSIPKLLEFSSSGHHPRLCFNATRLAADFLMAEGSNEEVLRALDNFLVAHPKSTAAWECAVIRQAFVLMAGVANENDLMEVERLYANPLPGHESNVTTLFGQYLLDFNRPQEVVDLIAQRIEYEPTLINHFQLGSALAAIGRHTRALEILHMGKAANTADLPGGQVEMFQQCVDTLIRELEKVY